MLDKEIVRRRLLELERTVILDRLGDRKILPTELAGEIRLRAYSPFGIATCPSRYFFGNFATTV